MRLIPGSFRARSEAISRRGRNTTPEQAALNFLSVAILLGVAGINVYASQFSGHDWPSTAGTAFLVAGAALGIGGLLGFLFGIPRAHQAAESTPPRRTTYEPNTNLEQISDWLTKILVGVGLTQIAQLPNWGTRLTDFLSPGLGESRSTGAFAAALLVYYAIAGFLLGYLWTSIHLAPAYSARDRDMERESFGANLGAATAKAGTPFDPKASSELLNQADRLDLASQSRRILWVDDQPENNALERQALSNLGLSVTLVRSTEDAISELENAKQRGRSYDVILSDIERPGSAAAGLEMLDRFRSQKYDQPVIFYVRKYDPSRSVPSGAFGITNRPDALVRMTLDAMEWAKR